MAVASGCTITSHSLQVAYEGRDPNINALRKAAKAQGLRVVSGSMGPQVTPVGVVKLNMMTIIHNGNYDALDAIQDEIAQVDSADVFKGM